MKRQTLYPTLEETYFLHKLLLERFGGDGGVRDPGLLESALARPRSGYYRSISEQAAALLQSLALNHAFVDGNKRIAYAMMDVFLRTNGLLLTVSAATAETFLIDRVINGHAPIEEIAMWIESRADVESR